MNYLRKSAVHVENVGNEKRWRVVQSMCLCAERKKLLLTLFANFLRCVLVVTVVIAMASNGSLELGAEDSEYCVNENVSTHNRYDQLRQRQDGGDSERENEFSEWKTQERKRKRKNTGSNSSSITNSFSSMSTDAKLDIIFSKLLTIEEKIIENRGY